MSEQYKGWKITQDKKSGEWVAKQDDPPHHILSDDIYGDLKKRVDQRDSTNT
jgi:hypothetical protein